MKKTKRRARKLAPTLPPPEKRPPGRPRLAPTTHFGSWMDERGFSVGRMAKVAGVSQTTIGALRRGLQLPSLEVATRLIEFSAEGACGTCGRSRTALTIRSFYPTLR